ncbi:MAG: RNA polymerase sigma factor [Candidatus Dormibacteraeota bacterium]|nr:RNA polymerase sigma factor [Candidatus Dormibacteraeota bacterium]
MGTTTDSDLIAEARGGNTAAFEELLSSAIAPGARLAYGMLQDRDAAEDAVQEAALKAWRRLGNVRPGAAFRPWFLGIVVNQVRSIRRTAWWSVLRLEGAPGLGTSAEIDPRGADFRRALLRVPPGQRAAILLHFYLDLPLDEVASVLGISVAGVKSRINRGLKRMRPALRGYEVLV